MIILFIENRLGNHFMDKIGTTWLSSWVIFINQTHKCLLEKGQKSTKILFQLSNDFDVSNYSNGY